MALDEEDLKTIAQLAAKAANDSLRPLADKLEKRMGESVGKLIQESLGEALTAREAAAKAAAEKPNPEAEERKTLAMRVKELEAERDAAREQAKAERTSAAFRREWAAAKFVPGLADDHLAALAASKRLVIDDEGAVRVRDPKKHKDETQPTLTEYMAELGKSERGKLYQAPPRTAGGAAYGAANGTAERREYNPAALDAVFGGGQGTE